MKKLFAIFLFPLSLLAQPQMGPYPQPGAGGGGLTNGYTFAPGQFTIVNGTNVWISSGVLLTNPVLAGNVSIGQWQLWTNLANNSVGLSNTITKSNAWVSFTNGTFVAGQNLLTNDAAGDLAVAGTVYAPAFSGGVGTFPNGIDTGGGVEDTTIPTGRILYSGGGQVYAGLGNSAGALTNNGSGTFGWLPLSSFGGGASQTPLTSDINAVGFSGTNYNNLNATNEVSYGITDPFPTPTRLVFDGNSRVSGFGNPWPHWPGILYSNLIPQSHLVQYVNLGVAGQTVEQDSANYTSAVHPYRPAGGTNAWLFWMDAINDSFNLTNLQTTINSMSNIFWNAKNDGFTLVILTTFEQANSTQSQLALLAQENDYCMTNQFADYVVNVAKTMSYNTIYSPDGVHPNAQGDTNIAKVVWARINQNKGSATGISQEGHFANYFDLYSAGDSVKQRNVSTTGVIASDYPAFVFDAAGSGATWLGQINGTFELATVSGNGNISLGANALVVGSPTLYQVYPAQTNNSTLGVNGVVTISSGMASLDADTPVSVGVGASPYNFTNTTGINLACQLTDTAAFSVTKNGVSIASSLASDAYTVLKPNSYITITYASTTPTLLTNSAQ